MSSEKSEYNFFEIEIDNGVGIIWLNHPNSLNAMNWHFWLEMPMVIDQMENDDEVRCVIIGGRGKSFSTGLDILDMGKRFPLLHTANTGEDRAELQKLIIKMQAAINSVGACKKPVIAAVQHHCIGGGLDLISACDIRLCTEDALFSLREVKVAIVADMGSLQRLPYIIGEGPLREMAFTGKDISANEAFHMGLVNHVFENYEIMMKEAKKMALKICKNPAFTVRGIKHALNHSRDMRLQEALDFIITYNSAFLHTQDLKNVFNKFEKIMAKRKTNK